MMDGPSGEESKLLLRLPADVQAVLREFRTCELTTLSKDTTPITWPVMAVYQPELGRFLLSTAIGLPQKVEHLRRDPRLSLLFSDATGSGLTDPPAVLVQADGHVGDEIVTWNDDVRAYHRQAWLRQPMSRRYSFSPIGRYLMGWYFRRLVITARPRSIFWWSAGDFSRPANMVDLAHVG